MTKLEAAVWAKMAGGNATFGSLAPGTPFRFPASVTIHRKGKRGWYIDPQGKRWQTGSHVAVLVGEEEV